MGDPALRLRLPVLTASIVLISQMQERDRKLKGWEWCRDEGVGALRRQLGAVPATFDPAKFTGAQVAVEIARDGSRVLLSETCRLCPSFGCSMKA